MNKCDQNCNTCSSKCISSCPICNFNGKNVPLITVKSLLKSKNHYLNELKAYICTNRKCPVIYFQEENPKYFTKDDVKTQIWFKTSLNEQIICYCHNIKLIDVLEIVKNSNDSNLTKEKIFELLNIKEENNCLYNNPLGEPCGKLFNNAIEFAYKHKEFSDAIRK